MTLANFRELIAGKELIVAPVALNPIMARLAEAAGFKAVYLSGGSLGWYKGVTEANITITELTQVAVDMRAASKLPVVLDAGGGFGDPVHMHRTIALTEAELGQLCRRNRKFGKAIGWCECLQRRGQTFADDPHFLRRA